MYIQIKLITIFASTYSKEMLSEIEKLVYKLSLKENILNPETSRFSIIDQFLVCDSDWFDCREVLLRKLIASSQITSAFHGNWPLSLMCLRFYGEKRDLELLSNFSRMFLDEWGCGAKAGLSSIDQELVKISPNLYSSFYIENRTKNDFNSYLIIPVKSISSYGLFTAYSALIYILRNWQLDNLYDNPFDFVVNELEHVSSHSNKQNNFIVWLLLYFFNLLGYSGNSIIQHKREFVNGPISFLDAINLPRVLADMHYLSPVEKQQLNELFNTYGDLLIEYISIIDMQSLINNLNKELIQHESSIVFNNS